MTVYSPRIQQELNSCHIFLDTNVFIYASKNKSFFDFLVSLKNEANCSFTTIPSVVFEFTNGSDSVDKYNERVDFINSLVDAVSPVSFLNTIADFYIVMAKVNDQNKAYTDFLLAASLYNYRRSKTALLTADLKAFPSFYTRTHILAVEHGKEIKNFGVYQFDSAGYAQAAANILSI